MNNNWNRAIMLSLVLIFSSLAGCLGNDSDDEQKTETQSESANLKTVMVSTYHVGELVSAVVGDSMTVEILNPSNTPVHDYDPSMDDIQRLGEADLFFYHGLDLEPWVAKTLTSLGSDAPPAFATHAMPTGDDTLDYESMLISELCEHLNEGPYENSNLSESLAGANSVILHAEHTAHKLVFHVDDDHADSDHDEHDGHTDGEHDEHHGEHEVHTPEEVLESIDTNNDSHVSLDEFLSGWNRDHGEHNETHEEHNETHEEHNETDEEHHEEEHLMELFNESDEDGDGLLNLSEFEHLIEEIDHHEHCTEVQTGAIAPEAGYFTYANNETTVFIANGTAAPENGTFCPLVHDHDEESNHVAILYPDNHLDLLDGDHDLLSNGNVTGWNLTVTTLMHHYGNHSLNYSTHDVYGHSVSGINGADAPSDYSWWWTLYVWNSTSSAWDESSVGVDSVIISDHTDHIAWAPNSSDISLIPSPEAHEHHDHEEMHDGHHEGEMVCYDMSTHSVNHTYITKATCETAGLMWTAATGGPGGHDGHDGHDDHNGTHDEHEGHNHAIAEHVIQNPSQCPTNSVISIFHLDEGSYVMEFESENLTTIEMVVLKMSGGHAGHDHGAHGDDDHADGDHDDHADGDHDDHADGDHNKTHAGHDDHAGHEDHGDHRVGFATIHIEETGDYGFALPSDLKFHILMGEGAHDDHDDHAGDDHDDHAGDDHDDHADEDTTIVADEDEAIDYDPHSWLDPLAFRAQIDGVLADLTSSFPDYESEFTANADAYKAKLSTLHTDYQNAFSDNGTCTNKTVAANHNAYAYIGERYGLEFVTVHGLDPEGEPSAADIAKVVEHIIEEEITVIFIEEYTNATALNSLVQQTVSSSMPNGVTVEYMYTMELPPSNSDDDYISLMNKNLVNLKSGLGC